MTTSSLITEDMKKAIGAWKLPQFEPQIAGDFAISRYYQALEDTNPLWSNEEYARKTRWSGIIAPPTFVEVFSPTHLNMRSNWKFQPQFPPHPNLSGGFLGYEDYEFFAPIRPGDAIQGTGGLAGYYEKQGRAGIGRMVFTEIAKEYRNQTGKLVATNKWGIVSVEDYHNAARQTSRKTGSLPPVKNNGPLQKQVCFEDVTNGTEIPSIVRDIPVLAVARWAGACGDLMLEHIDYLYATKELGLPDNIVHGSLMGALLAVMVTNWIGGWGVLKKHRIEYRGNVWPCDTLACTGKVTKKYEQGDEHLVEIESQCQNQHGSSTALGRSVTSLPLRNQVPSL
ncbi:MAG: MaoC family dehydratase N-terminal domain-containing protein [Chloroflexi bacterium]|nr:MaoC family dehydratase N-terminal domain-containing protein [Chloroflexota bacterium]